MNLFQTDLFDESNEKIKALDELFLRSATYHNSREYLNLLKFINKFPKLSPFNSFLIHAQNSGVKIVFSASQWAKYGRTINYQARPLVILIPFGPVDFVYDIADTGGKEVPPEVLNPFCTSGKFDIAVYERTIMNCEKEGLLYKEQEMHKDSAGYAHIVNDKFSLTINRSYSEKEKYSTIVHELAHIFCGHLGISESSWWKNRPSSNRTLKEIEAESVSFLVCKRIGLQTTSEAYLSGYISEHKEIPSISLDTVLTVSGYIEQMGKTGFRTKKKK